MPVENQQPISEPAAAMPEAAARTSTEQPRAIEPMTAEQPRLRGGHNGEGEAICCGLCAGLCCFECCECCC